ncbi:hypothetical protein LJC07_00240 [Christensenellaceae bacterium OttesenSCG-928-L17]|nr:hypothetical protein [Christensenellaceae bacterium OttesenSCG-928-L17]
MDWKARYRSKCVSAAEAVRHIPANGRVVIAHAAGESVLLTNAMVENHLQYERVEIIHMVPKGPCSYCAPGMEAHFLHNCLFAGKQTRDALQNARAEFTPCYFYELPELLRTTLPVDVALLQVAPPDEDGYCNYGISVDYTKPAVECAKISIAQVNPRMPRIYGDTRVHVDDIDWFVEADTPLILHPPATITEIERSIGKHCAAIIRDGDTLQLGIGAIPDAVLHALKDKRDLGVHTEMFTETIVDLMQAGVITNRKKTLHPGKSVATFLMGTQKLYDFANNNPDIELYPVDYVNDPRVIAQNDNMVSINSCVQVDLMGQVVSCSVGHKQISGVGGQVDFVRGANMARGGRSIIAMRSTTADGKTSKIVPLIDEGAAITTSRYDVNIVVTEYGAAHLKGQTLRERARRLISIAHPDFRPMLMEGFEQRFGSACTLPV